VLKESLKDYPAKRNRGKQSSFLIHDTNYITVGTEENLVKQLKLTYQLLQRWFGKTETRLQSSLRLKTSYSAWYSMTIKWILCKYFSKREPARLEKPHYEITLVSLPPGAPTARGPCLQQRFNGILEYVTSQIQDVVAMKLLQTCLKHKQRVTRKVGNGSLQSRRGEKRLNPISKRWLFSQRINDLQKTRVWIVSVLSILPQEQLCTCSKKKSSLSRSIPS
jgi:hypothetical protein